MKEYLRFVGAFIKSPHRIGAIAPSSDRLAHELLDGFNFGDQKFVVEIGPGNGAITTHLSDRLGWKEYLGVDLNPTFVEVLQKKFPDGSFVCGSVEDLDQILKDRGHEQCDLIVSSLPWALLSPSKQQDILRVTSRCLRPGGKMVTYAYLPAKWMPSGRTFRELLDENFSTVNESPIVWSNLPPAVAYHCFI